MKADKNAISDFLFFQEDEITSSIVYAKLAHIVKDSENKKTLLQIAAEEKAHYEILKRHTGKEVAPNRWRIFKYYWLARILGLTFAIKLMEKVYKELFGVNPTVQVVHAGLECSVILSKYPNLDIVSFGPTLCSPHTASERVFVPSIDKFWKLLIATLEQIPEK